MTKAQAIAAYNKWATDNGKPAADIGEIYSFINGQDPNKSQKDIEAEEKKMKRNEDWERVGNFLAHLGNFVGTISGAPSQELEPAINLTKRQQALRDKTMALRQKSVSDYLSTYRQKQDEALKQQNLELKSQQLEAKIKEQTAKIEDLKAKREIEKFKADTDREFKNESIEVRHKALEIQQRLAERRINIAQANAETNALRASLQKEKQDRDKNGYTVEKTDARGRKTTTVRRPNSPNNNNGSSQGRDNKSGKIKTKTQL
jgi:YD repeat-containing protein